MRRRGLCVQKIHCQYSSSSPLARIPRKALERRGQRRRTGLDVDSLMISPPQYGRLVCRSKCRDRSSHEKRKNKRAKLSSFTYLSSSYLASVARFAAEPEWQGASTTCVLLGLVVKLQVWMFWLVTSGLLMRLLLVPPEDARSCHLPASPGDGSNDHA